MPPIGSPRIYYPVPLFFGELPGTGIGTALIRIQKLSCIPALQPSQREPDSLVPRLSSLVFRPSSFVPRLSSLVLRLSSPGGRIQGGNRRGGSPLGREEGPGNLSEGSLALFLFHLSFCRTKRKTAAGGKPRGFTGSRGKRPAAAAQMTSALPQALRASSLKEGA